MRILNATPVTEVVLVVVSASGHNVITDVALVVLIFVYTFANFKTTNVTFVIARIFILTICHLFATVSTVVRTGSNFMCAHRSFTNITLVILVCICALGYYATTVCTVVRTGSSLVCAHRSFTNVTLVILVCICALGYNAATVSTVVRTGSSLVCAHRSFTNITLVILVCICALGYYATTVSTVVRTGSSLVCAHRSFTSVTLVIQVLISVTESVDYELLNANIAVCTVITCCKTSSCTCGSYCCIVNIVVIKSFAIFLTTNFANYAACTSSLATTVGMVIPLSINCSIRNYYVLFEIPRSCKFGIFIPACELIVSSSRICSGSCYKSASVNYN